MGIEFYSGHAENRLAPTGQNRTPNGMADVNMMLVRYKRVVWEGPVNQIGRLLLDLRPILGHRTSTYAPPLPFIVCFSIRNMLQDPVDCLRSSVRERTKKLGSSPQEPG